MDDERDEARRGGDVYGEGMAELYDRRWGHFARDAAPVLLAFARTHLGDEPLRVLDIGCGTGVLAEAFLVAGHDVTGIDNAPAMLARARARCDAFEREGRAHFREADAASFELDDAFHLVVSTYDTLNHLPDDVTLASCFERVHAHLREGGLFVFDLNTPAGLRERWPGIAIEDGTEACVIQRGVFDETGGRAWVQITAFLREADGRYRRVRQTAGNTAFAPAAVLQGLAGVGFDGVHGAVWPDLERPASDPDAAGRVWFVARRRRPRR